MRWLRRKWHIPVMTFILMLSLISGFVVYAEEPEEETKYSSEWRDGLWYEEDGTQIKEATGAWGHDEGGYWFGDTSGWRAKKCWQKIDGDLYYFDASGHMAVDAYIDGKHLSLSGKYDGKGQAKWTGSIKTGWKYVLSDASCLKKRWAKIDGKMYYFKQDGYAARNEWVKGYYWIGANYVGNTQVKGSWQQNKKGKSFGDSSRWYAKKCWLKIDGDWYYFDASGYMAANEYIDGYYLGKDGKYDGSGKAKWKGGTKSGWWYALPGGGYLNTCWAKIDGKWYYFKQDGYAARNEWVKGYYWIGANCSWTYKPKGSWHETEMGAWFGDTSGWFAKNQWMKINNKWYWFDRHGWLYTGTGTGDTGNTEEAGDTGDTGDAGDTGDTGDSTPTGGYIPPTGTEVDLPIDEESQ